MEQNPNIDLFTEDLYDRLFTECLTDAFPDAMIEQHMKCRLGNAWKNENGRQQIMQNTKNCIPFSGEVIKERIIQWIRTTLSNWNYTPVSYRQMASLSSAARPVEQKQMYIRQEDSIVVFIRSFVTLILSDIINPLLHTLNTTIQSNLTISEFVKNNHVIHVSFTATTNIDMKNLIPDIAPTCIKHMLYMYAQWIKTDEYRRYRNKLTERKIPEPYVELYPCVGPGTPITGMIYHIAVDGFSQQTTVLMTIAKIRQSIIQYFANRGFNYAEPKFAQLNNNSPHPSEPQKHDVDFNVYFNDDNSFRATLIWTLPMIFVECESSENFDSIKDNLDALFNKQNTKTDETKM